MESIGIVLLADRGYRQLGGQGMDAISACIVLSWFLLHAGALICGWATRLVVGSRLEILTQAAFFAAMTGVGGAAWFCRHLESSVWMASAVVLIAMVLTVVVDFRRTELAQALTGAASR